MGGWGEGRDIESEVALSSVLFSFEISENTVQACGPWFKSRVQAPRTRQNPELKTLNRS